MRTEIQYKYFLRAIFILLKLEISFGCSRLIKIYPAKAIGDKLVISLLQLISLCDVQSPKHFTNVQTKPTALDAIGFSQYTTNRFFLQVCDYCVAILQ